MSLKDMKILVTGASSGIGAHISQFLAREGARITVAARRIETLEALAAGYSGHVDALAMDVRDPESVRDGIAGAAERMGGLDGLVNNAGIDGLGRTLDLSEDDWTGVIDVNLNGVFRAAQAAARIMAEAGGGVILNTASILGMGTASNLSAYTASKAGVIHLTRNLAMEWARHGIRVNAIAPGYFPTEMNRGWLESEGGQEAAKAVPMRRWGRLEELEGPVELLLGPKGSYITGVTLPVDGGHLCRAL